MRRTATFELSTSQSPRCDALVLDYLCRILYHRYVPGFSGIRNAIVKLAKRGLGIDDLRLELLTIRSALAEIRSGVAEIQLRLEETQLSLEKVRVADEPSFPCTFEDPGKD